MAGPARSGIRWSIQQAAGSGGCACGGPSSGLSGGSWARANWTAPAALSAPGAITAHAPRGVWLIDVHSPYADVAPEVDHRIQTALAGVSAWRGLRAARAARPRAGAGSGPLGLSWASRAGLGSAAPVVLSCSDPRTSALLDGRVDGRRLRMRPRC